MNAPKVALITSRCPSEDIPDSLAVPFGLHLLRRYLASHEVDCDVVDLQLHSEEDCLEKIDHGEYDIIGISVSHWNMVSDLDFLWKIRQMTRNIGKDCLFIAGGFSATLNCHQWLECGFDLVCLGYAEETLQSICERFAPEKVVRIWQLAHDLNGVAFLDETGQMVFNPARPLTKADFERRMFDQAIEGDVPYDEYWAFMRQKATNVLSINNRSYVVENARLYTSSRCLADCGYCCCPAFLPTAQSSSTAPLIVLSAVQVHKLIVHHVHKYGARAFSFNDEDFLVGNKSGIRRAIELCELIVDSKRKGEIPEDTKFSCQTRFNDFLNFDSYKNVTINHQLMEALSQAQFHNISIGVETFSERLLQCPSINKGRGTLDDCYTVIETLMDHGLYPTINLILGIPESTPDELIETIEKAVAFIDKPCQISVANRMMSFPGAPLWNRDDYPTHGTMWTNPDTGKSTYIAEYYRPQDDLLSDLIDGLREAAGNELVEFKTSNNWNPQKLTPRIVISLCTFMAIAKILRKEDLQNSIGEKLQNLVTENLCA